LSSRFFLSLLLVAAWSGVSLAAQPSGTAQKQELKALRERIESLQKGLAASEEAKSETVDALRESERAISESNRLLRDLATDQRDVNARLAELRDQNQRTAGDLDAQRTRLARLLYEQYTGGQPDALKLLLNREDPNRIARDLHYLTYLARARGELIAGLRANLGKISDLTEETQQRSSELAAINAAQQSQRKRLEAEKAARKAVLLKVSRQIESQRREISTLKRDETRLTRLIERLTQMLARAKPATPRHERLPDAGVVTGAFGQLKGHLSLPVRGPVKNRFGSQREGSGVLWKGLFIASQAGQDVKSIAAGRVVFADWLRGFGNLMIIDHGDGYMSLYGNNESLFKQVGDAAKSGETIAAVGNSGGNMDSGLYFEIRYQGVAFDPLAWVSLR
jgi:murein hydrolase activator